MLARMSKNADPQFWNRAHQHLIRYGPRWPLQNPPPVAGQNPPVAGQDGLSVTWTGTP